MTDERPEGLTDEELERKFRAARDEVNRISKACEPVVGEKV